MERRRMLVCILLLVCVLECACQEDLASSVTTAASANCDLLLPTGCPGSRFGCLENGVCSDVPCSSSDRQSGRCAPIQKRSINPNLIVYCRYSAKPAGAQCTANACMVCNGVRTTCVPGGVVAKDAAVCRKARGSATATCDVEERCDGIYSKCPRDAFKKKDTVCYTCTDGTEVKCSGTSATCQKPAGCDDPPVGK